MNVIRNWVRTYLKQYKKQHLSSSGIRTKNERVQKLCVQVNNRKTDRLTDEVCSHQASNDYI